MRTGLAPVVRATPTIRLPARLLCPSRFTPSVASLCNTPSCTTQDHSNAPGTSSVPKNEARRAGDAQIFRQRAVAVDDGLSSGLAIGFRSLGIKADFARDSQNRCFFLQSQDSGWNRFPSPLTEQMPNRTSCP